MKKITERIERELGVPNLSTLLGERLDPTDLQSLLLDIYRRVVGRRSPKMLLSDYKSSRFFHASQCDPAALLEWDRIALSNLPRGFRALEVSPVCPLGTISLLTPISQDWVLTTIRNAEALADPTNVLALECALRRYDLNRADQTRKTSVNLVASQRVVRSQKYDSPEARAHFRLFSMCSAGRDSGNLRFEVEAVSEHLRFYLKCLRLYLGSNVPLRASIIDLRQPEPHRTSIISAIAEDLKRDSKNVTVQMTNSPAESKGYYNELRFHVYATSIRGMEIELVDGGDTDWTQRLLGNAKERLIISGIGTERLCNEFTRHDPALRASPSRSSKS